jgi:hypothetical protein
MRIEVLYFDGCPGFAELMPRLRAMVTDQPIDLRAITTPEAAQAERFLGSPTVRVDGVDVETAAAGRRDYGLKCRLYATRDGLGHAPDEAMLATALT